MHTIGGYSLTNQSKVSKCGQHLWHVIIHACDISGTCKIRKKSPRRATATPTSFTRILEVHGATQRGKGRTFGVSGGISILKPKLGYYYNDNVQSGHWTRL